MNEHKLNTSIYETILENKGSITVENTYFDKNLNSEDLTEAASKHHIFSSLIGLPSELCIIFSFGCEYTGIHYHNITITIYSKNGTIAYKQRHSSCIDGTLCYAKYYPFLISKITYFESIMPTVPIYIHKCILSLETFYDEKHCNDYC